MPSCIFKSTIYNKEILETLLRSSNKNHILFSRVNALIFNSELINNIIKKY